MISDYDKSDFIDTDDLESEFVVAPTLKLAGAGQHLKNVIAKTSIDSYMFRGPFMQKCQVNSLRQELCTSKIVHLLNEYSYNKCYLELWSQFYFKITNV